MKGKSVKLCGYCLAAQQIDHNEDSFRNFSNIKSEILEQWYGSTSDRKNIFLALGDLCQAMEYTLDKLLDESQNPLSQYSSQSENNHKEREIDKIVKATIDKHKLTIHNQFW